MSQVLIGVGVLLWGTPLLLILGYTFLNVLQILLPVSLCISFLQILLYRKYIDFNLLKKYSVTSLPGIVIGLLLTIYFSLNLNVAVGMTLILVVLSRTFPRYVALGGFFIKNKLPVMFVIGVIHGFTNLGGALLVTIISFEKLSKNSELMAFHHNGFWQPMDTLREKNMLEDMWASGNAKWKKWK